MAEYNKGVSTPVYTLSTTDNPFNPFKQHDEWDKWDRFHGHHCASLLARFANTSIELSNEDNNQIISDAIDEIIKYDPTGKFVKIRM